MSSGGNPFFALELARALDAGAAPLDPAQPLPVPDSLEHLVGDRLRALPEETRKALLVVAVTGSPAPELVEAAGIDEETLAPAVAAEVLERANGVIRFTHPLLASAAIAEATASERQRAHRLVADAVDDPVIRARHVAAALTADAKDAATAQLLEEAAELARSRGAPSIAAELGEAAARATPPNDEDDRRRRTIQASRAHLAAGSAERALTLGARARRAARPGPARAEALALLGRCRERGRREHGGRPLPPGSSRARASTRARAGASPRARGQPAHHGGPGASRRRQARRAVALADGTGQRPARGANACDARDHPFQPGRAGGVRARPAGNRARPSDRRCRRDRGCHERLGPLPLLVGSDRRGTDSYSRPYGDRPPGETSPPRRRRSGSSRSSRSGLAG